MILPADQSILNSGLEPRHVNLDGFIIACSINSRLRGRWRIGSRPRRSLFAKADGSPGRSPP
eukprot:scaffold40074_cov36-Prasinocladus_malaysianus.AAC.1